jgi:hypothetical protein
MEYIEQRPPVLNKTSMGTMICNYYKKPENDKTGKNKYFIL